jgi:hypothetical protein
LTRHTARAWSPATASAQNCIKAELHDAKRRGRKKMNGLVKKVEKPAVFSKAFPE